MLPQPRRILIIQLRRIGDVLLTAPATETLARAFPQAKIDFITERPCDEVLRGNPHVADVIIYDRRHPLKAFFDVRRRKYDWVIDLMTNPRTRLIALFSGAPLRAGPAFSSAKWAYNVLLPLLDNNIYAGFKKVKMLEPLGVKTDACPRPFFALPPFAAQYRRGVFEGLGIRPGDLIIGLAPASRKATRRWPAEHYAELARLAAKELGAKTLVFCGPGEEDIAAEIAGKSGGAALIPPPSKSLAELASLLAGLKVLVCNCNGTKHLAAAAGTPTLEIYGMSNPASWHLPGDPRHRAVYRTDLPCIGCGKSDCDIGIKCLRELPPQTVFGELRELLSRL
ncbi:MAG: glycosyltransferase family 9 protein [Elusimicrobiales bacterium]